MAEGLISNKETKIGFKWKTKTFAGAAVEYLELYNSNGTALLDGNLSSRAISVIAQQENESEFTWPARWSQVIGARKAPIPIGTYAVRIKFYCSGLQPLYSNYEYAYLHCNDYDYDGDDISSAVENKNSGTSQTATPIVDQNGGIHYDWFNYSDVNYPPLIPKDIISSNPLYPNRGTHDYSLALGTIGGGSIKNPLRIANSSTGYQQDPGADPRDYDNWGTLALINLLEKVGRQWNSLHPDYPIVSYLDMSVWQGGYWSDHIGHQNGLEVDIRYVCTDGNSTPVTIESNYYSRERTQELVDLFNDSGIISVIISGDDQLDGITIDNSGLHDNHLHLRIIDPDGTSN